MQRKEPGMEDLTTEKRKLTRTTFTTKKRKTIHPEINVSFDLLGIVIQGDIRSKHPPRLGSIENPRLRELRMKTKVKGDYYYRIKKDGEREISYWDGKWKCEHGRRRSRCKECGGGSICGHGRVRSTCKECDGGSICEHGRRRSICKECDGSQICEHGRERQTCKNCDPHNYFAQIMRSNVRNGLRRQGRKKRRHTKDYIGCSFQQLKKHLESQFEEGMSWDNMGTKPDGTRGWDVDHRRPCASFDFENEDEKYMCWHWTNLQPMWHEENIRKLAYYDEAIFPYKWMGLEIGWVGRIIKTEQSDLRKKYKCIP